MIIQTSDPRVNAIIYWLEHTLNFQLIKFEVASCDASFRRYFRVTHHQGQHIIMDAPPEKENIKPFVRLAKLFKSADINVPEIYHQDFEQGFLLLEDFGSRCYLDTLDADNFLTLYSNAFDSIISLQRNISSSTNQFPNYDDLLLEKELNIFYEWFLKQSLNLVIPEDTKDKLNQVLINSALEQPQVCVHRDFHSRNLMVLTENSPGIIDFQDALVGPISYDLVSLLRDCYITWPEQQVEEWMTLYYHRLIDSNLINTDLKTFSRWFDFMGLQRHLKAIGIFSRLNIRDNKPSYLADIPRTIDYVTQICNKYPELFEFNQFLTDIVLPLFNNKK